ELMSVITSKGFKKYATEQRIGVLEHIGLDDREYWEILDILGLTFKPLQSLTFKPEYEWACDFLRNHSSNKDKLVNMGLIKSVDDLEPYEGWLIPVCISITKYLPGTKSYSVIAGVLVTSY